MNKKKVSFISLVTATLIMIAGCDSEQVAATNTASGDVIVADTATLNGIAVDGYLSSASVCLDVNINGICESDEPLTATRSDGSFQFSNLEIPANKLFSVIVFGGTDNATNKSFDGEIRNVVSTTDMSSFVVSPVTDLVARVLYSSSKDVTSLKNARTQIAKGLNVSEQNLVANPMIDMVTFTKAQEIQQTKVLLNTSVLKTLEASKKDVSNELTIKDDIKIAIVNNLININDGKVDISKVLVDIEKAYQITIPENEKTFLISQINDIRTSLFVLKTNSNTDFNLLQSSLETQMEIAQSRIALATNESKIEIVPASQFAHQISDSITAAISSSIASSLALAMASSASASSAAQSSLQAEMASASSAAQSSLKALEASIASSVAAAIASSASSSAAAQSSLEAMASSMAMVILNSSSSSSAN